MHHLTLSSHGPSKIVLLLSPLIRDEETVKRNLLKVTQLVNWTQVVLLMMFLMNTLC